MQQRKLTRHELTLFETLKLTCPRMGDVSPPPTINKEAELRFQIKQEIYIRPGAAASEVDITPPCSETDRERRNAIQYLLGYKS
jgi:hypothetical protein